ncbi:hypothetical protein RJT34_32747 [Clitoria ternatea]|uniref:Defective in cullin neddylation protein n=1 Tax=Clitoria ternatea TaxID=43366 RepID=A0AAN9EXI2_CLITE
MVAFLNFHPSAQGYAVGLVLVSPEGIEALCKDVNVEHTDVRMLILAWKLKAEKQGYFSKVMEPDCFEDFYSYAFQYCLTGKISIGCL